jgi:toxin-antitoxin system PIN domain toxin
VILVDANILLYAEHSLSPWHAETRTWWDEQLSGSSPVCLCWTVISAFIRIGTNARVFAQPLSLNEAINRVQSWIDHPCTRLIYPTQWHWEVFRQMLTQGHALWKLVTDAYLAALAVAHGCELYSTDTDFSRFPQLQWRNPLHS